MWLTVARLRSPRGLLATSATLDLIGRLPEDLLVPTLSLVGGFLGNPTVAFLTTWLLIVTALYTFAPLAYDYVTVLPTQATGFRAIFAGGAVPCGIVLQRSNSPRILVATVFLTAIGTSVLYLGYLSFWHEWRLFDPDGQAPEMLKTLFPRMKNRVARDIESDLAYEGLLGTIAIIVYFLAIGVVLGLPVVIAATVAQVLVYAYPVPDLVFLGWASSVYILPRVSRGPDRQRIPNVEFDFERVLIDTIENATRSLEGLCATFFLVLGLFASSGYLFVGVGLAPATLQVVADGMPVLINHPSLRVATIIWNNLGLSLLLLFVGCYGIWAWVREIRRLPHFLDVQEPREREDDTEPISRPPGLIVVPFLAWLLAIVYVHFFRSVSIVYAVVWPVTIGGGLWTVRWTLRRPAQSVRREYRWIVAALVLHVWSYWLVDGILSINEALTGDRSLFAVLTFPVAVTVLLLLAGLVPAAHRYEAKHDDFQQYSMVMLVVTIGILSTAAVPLVPDRFRIFAILLALVGVGLGSALGIVEYYDL